MRFKSSLCVVVTPCHAAGMKQVKYDKHTYTYTYLCECVCPDTKNGDISTFKLIELATGVYF